MLQQLGKHFFKSFRHAWGRPEDLHGNTKRKAGYDVLCHFVKGDPPSLPQIYAPSNSKCRTIAIRSHNWQWNKINPSRAKAILYQASWKWEES
jgi:hypothetical protein